VRVSLAVVAIAITACRDDAAPAAPPPPPTVVTPVDAATVDAITFVPGFDPASGMHVDEGDDARTGTGGVTPRSRRNIEILLRSTPPGATAVVDGRVIGKTPTYWEGEFTGRERDFTFMLPGHALARYKFVPTTSGIVHARLTQITTDRDAGMPEMPPLVEESRPPPPPPPPRRTVDAAPALDAMSAQDTTTLDAGDAAGTRVVGPEP
jgi:hypothetical protein